MRAVIGCVCGWFLSLPVFCQETTGLGNPLFFSPATVFVSPGMLSDSSTTTALSIFANQFTDLAITRRMDAAGCLPLHEKAGMGFRISNTGREQFKEQEIGIAYGRGLGTTHAGNLNWKLGLLFQYHQQKIQAVKANRQWVAGISIAVDARQHLISMLFLKGSSSLYKDHFQINARQYWSDQVSTEIFASYNGEHLLQTGFNMQYNLLDRAYLRMHWQIRPDFIAWEQSYRLGNCWLIVQAIRYPMIGWKSGFGLVWNTIKTSKNHE